MGKTLAEKILSHASDEDLKAKDYAFANVDLAMANDITAPLAVDAFYEVSNRVWDNEKIIFIFDHQAPADSIDAANNQIKLRKFAKEQDVKLYDVGEGVCHQLMLENHAKPGQLIIGADSHTCTYGAVGAFATGVGSTDMGAALATGKLWFKVPETIEVILEGELGKYVSAKDIILQLAGDIGADGALYKALEFKGEAIGELDISERATICNMAIEVGAKTGIIEPDEATEEFIQEKAPNWLYSDEDADYVETVNYNINKLEPKVAKPHEVDNVVDIGEVTNTELDQVFIGSCTNGRYQDLKMVEDVLGDRSFSDEIRTIIVPASKKIYKKAMRNGLLQRFTEAGAVVQSPSCGPCMGGSYGLLGDGEVGLATSNRNFRGREGSPNSMVYLSSPTVAAESAIKGKISDPRRKEDG